MKEFVFVFIGGGLGSALRYAVHLLINGRSEMAGFPWSTFTVNVVGCFLIGIFYSLSARFNLTNETRLMLTVGFCGGFTTFSAFSNECFQLLKSGVYGIPLLYIVSSLVLGVLAVYAGAMVSK